MELFTMCLLLVYKGRCCNSVVTRLPVRLCMMQSEHDSELNECVYIHCTDNLYSIRLLNKLSMAAEMENWDVEPCKRANSAPWEPSLP